jgi:protein-ribulosamine 3-kinase
MPAIPQHIIDDLPPGIGRVTASRPLAGGDTCAAWRLDTPRGAFFLKLPPAGAATMTQAESVGLRALGATHTVRVPQVLAAGGGYLLLEHIAAGAPADGYWCTLARQLARLHGTAQPGFGFVQDNYCGRSQQPNPPMSDGYRFFAECRLLLQAERAARQGRLQAWHLRAVESICARLEQLVPPQEPALLHGDLWSGNHFAAADGQPVVVDPACYWGWPEADLAMMVLFGRPPAAFFARYLEHRPLPAGWQQRFELYNLYHLMNHLNLFGDSYRAGVEDVLRRFG